MGIDTNHTQYDNYKPEWKKCRDAAAGQMAVHKAKEKYLPRLSGQTDDEYKAYVMRTLFYGATGRTIEGLVGMVFSKPSNIDQGGMESMLIDIDACGQSIDNFAEFLMEETIKVGRSGLLVDFPAMNVENLTVAVAESMGVKPFIKHYPAEAIYNWRKNEVRLIESYEEQGEDEFTYEHGEQRRILDLDDTGMYRQRVYREVKSKTGVKEWVLVQELFPMMNGQRMDFIPFVFVNPNNFVEDVQKPPLISLVDTNLSHYRTTADYEHGAHFTALPTAVISGFTPDEEQKFAIGSTTAWTFGNPDTTAKYLEFEGKGLDSLKDLMEAKEKKMASLGVQMIQADTKRNEATETASIRHLGENSVLAAMASNVSDALNKCLEWAAIWMNTTPATIELNTDYVPVIMSPQMLRELVASWQSGAISASTLFENLKRGEVIDSQKSFDDEVSDIQSGLGTII